MTLYYKIPITQVNVELATKLTVACLHVLKIVSTDDSYFIPNDLLIMYPDLVTTYDVEADKVDSKLLILSDPSNKILQSVDWYEIHMDIQTSNNYVASICDNKVLVPEIFVGDYVQDYLDQGLTVTIQ
jgi:hypothetical protein